MDYIISELMRMFIIHGLCYYNIYGLYYFRTYAYVYLTLNANINIRFMDYSQYNIGLNS